LFFFRNESLSVVVAVVRADPKKNIEYLCMNASLCVEAIAMLSARLSLVEVAQCGKTEHIGVFVL